MKQNNEAYSRAKQFSKEDLIRCSNGKLFGFGNAQLPSKNMLMLDRIVKISEEGGIHNKGEIIAELDINHTLWFFECHFIDDPVMPGCLGLDAMWQLVGFYLGWKGFPGRGRALGCGEVKFTGQILPKDKLISYKINIKRIITREKATLGIASGSVSVDNKEIYTAEGLRVGLFQNTENF